MDNSRSLEFKIHETKGNEKNSVWFYFLQETNGGAHAKCKKCNKVLKLSGRSTKSLHTHLNTIHNINVLKRPSETISSSTKETDKTSESASSKFEHKSKKLMTAYFSPIVDNSLEVRISRLAAVDSLPFSIFCKSVDLRDLFTKCDFVVPKSPATIRNIVIEYNKKIRDAMVAELENIKENGGKFSVTFDEWTSTGNRRYMNVNVHGSGSIFWNLGLARITGSLNAESFVGILKEKLENSGICLDSDVVCIGTDGASAMVKVGKLINAEQQLCMAHGLQLAVIDVLYKKTLLEEECAVEESSDCENNELLLSESANDELDEDQAEAEDDGNMIIENNINVHPEKQLEFLPNVDDLIKKVRTLCKIFKRSPLKNEALQKYAKEKFKKELSLILDCKTRWNSLLDMLERFLKLKDCIQKALIDVKSAITVSEKEFDQISVIVNALQPVKIAVESLCQRDSNLLTADAIIKFLLNKIDSQKTDLSERLKFALETRIQQRRTDMSSVLQYLHNHGQPDDLGKDSNSVFKPLKRNKVKEHIKNLYLRLGERKITEFVNVLENENGNENKDTEKTEIEDDGPEISLKDELKLAIQKCMVPSEFRKKKNNDVQEIDSIINKEMSLLEGGGSRGRVLETVYGYLMSIKPTTVEPERAFSSSALFATKIRSRLADDSLDSLCFLRSYFLATKK